MKKHLGMALVFLLGLVLLGGCNEGSGGSSDHSSLTSVDTGTTRGETTSTEKATYDQDVVFMGDSITAGNQWANNFNWLRVANLAAGGASTGDMVQRLQTALAQNPRYVCVMGGINDLRHGYGVDTAYSNLEYILTGIADAGAKPIVQSTLYVANTYSCCGRDWQQYNAMVDQLNERLAALCLQKGWAYLDVNASLSANGSLRAEYTSDGIHLMPGAYSVWAELLKPLLP